MLTILPCYCLSLIHPLPHALVQRDWATFDQESDGDQADGGSPNPKGPQVQIPYWSVTLVVDGNSLSPGLLPSHTYWELVWTYIIPRFMSTVACSNLLPAVSSSYHGACYFYCIHAYYMSSGKRPLPNLAISALTINIVFPSTISFEIFIWVRLSNRWAKILKFS